MSGIAIALICALVISSCVAYVLWRVYAPHPDVWTDAAYVRVHYATVAPRVAGQVVEVLVDDNDLVKSGDVLMRIDGRDYQVALQQSEANLQSAHAQVENAQAALEHQGPVIAQVKSKLDASMAQFGFAQADSERYDKLAATGSGTVQSRQKADVSLLQAKADTATGVAALDAENLQLKVLQAQLDSAKATVEADEAAVQQARLNLGYTEIRAAIGGMVAQRSVQKGNYVSVGAGLMNIVPLDEMYVEANYREVDLRHVRAGQTAKIHVDAYDVDLTGKVVAVPAGTSATFSIIQPDNATGNFTKIVQRLPVRIDIDPNQTLAGLLRTGLSVETTIQTGSADVVGERLHGVE